jgi:Amt family ammonium transporter
VSVGIRLTDEEEHNGADISIHKIGAYPEDELVRR